MGIYLDTLNEISRVFNMTSTILLLLVATAVQGAVIKSPHKQLRKIPPWGVIIDYVKDLGPSYEADDSYQKQDAYDLTDFNMLPYVDTESSSMNGDDDSKDCDCVYGSGSTEQDCDCDYGDDRKEFDCGSDGTKQACDYVNGDNTQQSCKFNHGDTDCNQTDEKHKKKASQNDKKKGGYPQCKLDYLPPKPKSRCCGADGVTRGYIHGGNETQLGQYPWLVYLEYYDAERREKFYECGGSLISGRHVLTAAHCHKDPNSNPAIAVHVGDHYIHHPGPDCFNGSCNDGDTRILIESFVTYPKYEKRRSEYDIALIRLQKPVSFSDFVRPICLPSFDIYKDIEIKPTLYVAGWGETEQGFLINNLMNEKRAVGLPIKNVEDCRWIRLKHKIICAGGDKGKDSCFGDSGGPLMMAKDGQYYLVGVVANGPLQCGNGTPAVYTHVYKYVPWIYEQIEA